MEAQGHPTGAHIFEVEIAVIGHPKSREILMFVCLQKDGKQCCDVTRSIVLLVVMDVEDEVN